MPRVSKKSENHNKEIEAEQAVQQNADTLTDDDAVAESAADFMPVDDDILAVDSESEKNDGPQPGEETDDELLEGIPEEELKAVSDVALPKVSNRTRHVAKARNHRSGDGGVTMLTGDPVRMYLKEIGRVQLLTGPQEIDLAMKIEAGVDAAAQLYAAEEQVIELACNLDDMTPEELSFAMEELFRLGALDVYFTNIGMKKSRPGVILTCMCRADKRDEMLSCIFKNTTTLGVREYVCSRYELIRSIKTVQTRYGPVRVKTAEGYGAKRSKAEYDDLERLARENDTTPAEIRKLIK